MIKLFLLDGTHDIDCLFALFSQLIHVPGFFNDILFDHVFECVVEHDLWHPGDLAEHLDRFAPFLIKHVNDLFSLHVAGDVANLLFNRYHHITNLL